MKTNRRKVALVFFMLTLAFLAWVLVAGSQAQATALQTDFTRKNLAPCPAYPFGTDWMGRDMFARTLAGLAQSMSISLVTATVSACIALALGALAALGGRWADSLVTWLIDLVMGIPHILLLLLISFACGKGFFGVAIGIIFTHWMSLARLLRSEILQLRQSGFVQVAQKLGQTRRKIFFRHILPHLAPQFTVGLVLLFPHAILHEASITFLGFGLAPEQPAIGVILSESMRYLITGNWWLAVFPGALLVLVVALFHTGGSTLRQLLAPASAHE